jgi:hypothetical protein
MLYFDKKLTQKEVMKAVGITVSEFQRIFAQEGWRTRYNTAPILSEEERNQAIKERRERHSLKVRELHEQLFGTTCYSCGLDKNEVRNDGRKNILQVHRKDGAEHSKTLFRSLKSLRAIKPEEYVLLCIPCHRTTHFLMSNYSISWEKIDSHLEPKKNRSDTSKQSSEPEDATENLTLLSKLNEQYEHLDNQELREAIFGTDCCYCGPAYGERQLIIHRKDGTPHEQYLLWSREFLLSINPDEWVAVCQDCHTLIHWTMDRFGLDERFLFPE